MEAAHAAASAKSPWDTGLAFAVEAEVMKRYVDAVQMTCTDGMPADPRFA